MKNALIIASLILTIISPMPAYAQPKASEIINTPSGLDPLNGKFTSPAQILFELFKYGLIFSGLILFFMLIAGGFELMFGAGDPKSAEAGKTRITNAFIGFIIIFTSYWITQILEVILGINILK